MQAITMKFEGLVSPQRGKLKKLLWIIQLFAVVAIYPAATQAALQTPENVVVSTNDQVLQVLRETEVAGNPQSVYDKID